MEDICMRCIVTKGSINFKKNALVVSFSIFNLWQKWHELHFFAKQFLDFEPGIYYPQLQMQSAVTGIHTICIFKSIKNSQKQDEEGVFINIRLPELKNVRAACIHEAWKMTAMEHKLYKVIIGKDYFNLIVDIEATQKAANHADWRFTKTKEVKE